MGHATAVAGPLEPRANDGFTAMLIIINDDQVYSSWISRHRKGFVVDFTRSAKGHATLHRATCLVVTPHKRARLTTGGHIKACAMTAEELQAWAIEENGKGLLPCAECRPNESALAQSPTNRALSRLERNILSHLLDLAVMCLDGETDQYHADVQSVAAYFQKTPAQALPTLRRLITCGYLDCEGSTGGSLPLTAMVYPTARALGVLPAFGSLAPEALNAELAKLRSLAEVTGRKRSN
jgi:hypothetical protein